AFRCFEPPLERASFTASIDARTLPSRVYQLVANRATGLLVARNGDQERRIFLVNGAPRFVSSTAREELLGVRLLRRDLVDPEKLERALGLRARGAMHLGEILVSMGALPESVLQRELTEQLESRFVQLFSWRNGALAFCADMKSGEDEGEEIGRASRRESGESAGVCEAYGRRCKTG